MSTRPTAIVIGAGVAGLAAAIRLGEIARSGANDCPRPVLLEREERPGGLARSLSFSDVTTDMGPHRIHTELPEVDRLIARVAAPSLFTVPRASHIYLNGQFLAYPPNPFDMTRRLGPWRMGRFMSSFAAERVKGAMGLGGGAETYESLMRAAFGKALYEYLLKPYSAKTWKIDPAELHADTARVRVSAGSLAKMIARLLRRETAGHETALRHFRYVRGGIETLVRHLREQAESLGAVLELKTEVRALELDETTGRVRAALCAGSDYRQDARQDGPQDGRRYPGEIFLSTAPLPVLLDRLLPPVTALADARAAAAGLEYLDIIFICLVVRRERLGGDNWLYFPEPHLIFNRGYEAKSFDPSMGPEGRTVLCLEITARRGDPLWTESDERLIKTVTEQVASTGLLRPDEVAEAFVYHLPFAYPLYKLDYDTRLARTLAGLGAVGNLLTLGRQGLFNHNNMDHSIAMGLEAGELAGTLPPHEAARRWPGLAAKYKTMRIVD